MPKIYVLPNRPAFKGYTSKDPKKNTKAAGSTDSIEYAWFGWRRDEDSRTGSIELLDLTPIEERRIPKKEENP